MSNQENPYSPPTHAGTPAVQPVVGGRFPLATLWQRFAGNFIDSMVLLATMIPLFMAILFFAETIRPGYIDLPETIETQVIETVLILASLVVAFLIVNGYLLAKRGQTVGKLVMGTRIVNDRTGGLVPLPQLFLLRYLLLWMLVMIPLVGGFINLANMLAIFRDNRKCLHDEFAKTKVVMTIPSRHKRTLPDKIEIPDLPNSM